MSAMLVLSLRSNLIDGLVFFGEGVGVIHPVDIRSNVVRTGFTCPKDITLLRVKLVLQMVQSELEVFDAHSSDDTGESPLTISDREYQMCEQVHALLLQDVHDERDADRFCDLLNEPEMIDLLSGAKAEE